jgi:hypothetical protein
MTDQLHTSIFLPPLKESSVLIKHRLSGPQGRFRRDEERNSASAGTRTPIFYPVSSHVTGLLPTAQLYF